MIFKITLLTLLIILIFFLIILFVLHIPKLEIDINSSKKEKLQALDDWLLSLYIKDKINAIP